MNTFDFSPAMKATLGAKTKHSKYPWHELEPGKCFTINETAIKMTSLVTLAYRMGKRHSKKFKVLHHKDQNVYEVARVDGLTNE